MSSVVLDASATLAVIHREQGHQKALPHLEGAIVSTVNYAEVLKKAVERGTDLALTRLYLRNFMLVIVPFNEQQAERTASIWTSVKSGGLSFADRACLALAMERESDVLTADQRLSQVNLGIRVKLIR